MTALDVMNHFRSVGEWVDWDRTCDQFLHGDPSREVSGIATAWIATNDALRDAAERGLNLFVTHEPAFYHGYEHSESGRRLAQEKRALIDELAITLMRCHDTWDRMPEVGIPDSWARHLGLPTEPRPVESFYKVCLVDGMTVGDVASHVLDKVCPLGQDAVLILGDEQALVSRMAVGTGAITYLPAMLDLGVDIILATDDGMNFWDGGLWAIDLGIPLLLVNHATAEKPGMMAMATYLSAQFPGTPVEYVDVAMPYSAIAAR